LHAILGAVADRIASGQRERARSNMSAQIIDVVIARG
jgi:hypothetical protein